MALKLTDAGGDLLLNIAFGDSTYPKPTSYYLELFTDSNSLADSDGGGSTRTPAPAQSPGTQSGGTIAGYPAAGVNLMSLVNASSLLAGVPVMEWDDIVFTFTGPLAGGVSIKGYMVIMSSGPANNVVVFEELLDTPFTPANNGDKLTISLQFKMGNGTPL